MPNHNSVFPIDLHLLKQLITQRIKQSSVLTIAGFLNWVKKSGREILLSTDGDFTEN